MPMSAAAQAGIKAHGRHWLHTLDLHGQPARLGDEEALVVGDVLKIRESIIRDLRAFTERSFKRPSDILKEAILSQIDELEMIDDDPDELKAVLTDLYDIFDFHRVCVVA